MSDASVVGRVLFTQPQLAAELRSGPSSRTRT